MKKILLICTLVFAIASCQEQYELNTDFIAPTELSSPSSIQLDVKSSVPVVLSCVPEFYARVAIIKGEVNVKK